MSWRRITDLFVGEAGGEAEIGLIGAPMERMSVNPAAYARGPAALRAALARFSTYDVETGEELALAVRDYGDLPIAALTPAEALRPIAQAVERSVEAHGLTLLAGGHNGITRPAAHGLGAPLDEIGLITLDAHFDLRGTQDGLMNGNPVRALLEDGLPGTNICQIGLAPFANTSAMHRDAQAAGIHVVPIADVKQRGIEEVLDEALARLAHCSVLMVDFDIDVIDRAQCPGASGARPGGMSADMFFAAARILGGHPMVALADLSEFDPGRDVGEITALTAGRWFCELLAGFASR
jgi:formiminoglutamase